MKAYRTACHLLAHRLATPLPLAVFEERHWGFVQYNVYATEAITDYITLRQYRRTLPDGVQGLPDVLQLAADYTRRMHDSGLWHRDMVLSNFLLAGRPGTGASTSSISIAPIVCPMSRPGCVRSILLVWIGRPGTRSLSNDIAAIVMRRDACWAWSGSTAAGAPCGTRVRCHQAHTATVAALKRDGANSVRLHLARARRGVPVVSA